jgi:hypothetical protein
VDQVPREARTVEQGDEGRKCPACGELNPGNSSSCKSCAAPLPQEEIMSNTSTEECIARTVEQPDDEKKTMRQKRKEALFGGLALLAFGGGSTAWQIARWNSERTWVILRVWFFPIPWVLITAVLAVAGFIILLRGIFNAD